MASTKIMVACLVISMSLCISAALGKEGITCENLDRNSCAFAVSSTGERCVLEKNIIARRGVMEKFACRTSGIKADNGIRDFIETDSCVEACGLDRNTLGISSDALLDSGFTKKLCSPQCYQACSNVVDLYFSLAAGEGIFLPKICESVQQQSSGARRAMTEIKSSGAVLAAAEGPETSKTAAVEAAAAPMEAMELLLLPPAPM